MWATMHTGRAIVRLRKRRSRRAGVWAGHHMLRNKLLQIAWAPQVLARFCPTISGDLVGVVPGAAQLLRKKGKIP